MGVNVPRLTPAMQDGTRFIYPNKCELGQRPTSRRFLATGGRRRAE